MIRDLPFHVSRRTTPQREPVPYTLIDGRAYFLPGWPARTPAPSQPTAPARNPSRRDPMPRRCGSEHPHVRDEVSS